MTVAVAAEESLVAHAVCAALADRGVWADAIQWFPSRTEDSPGHQLATLHADVGLLLCSLDPLTQLAAALWLVRQSSVSWLVLSEQHARPAAGAMLEAGCLGVWPADSGLEDVVALLECADREPVAGQQRAAQLRRWRALPRRRRAAVGRLASLTARERSVLMSLATGLRVEQIAARDGVAVATVRTQVRAVLRKLEASSQLEAVAIVQSLGGAPARLVSRPEPPVPDSPSPLPPPGS